MFSLVLLLSMTDPSAVEAAGRLDYVVSRCGVFGWEADDEERRARLERLISQAQGRSREDILREFSLGVRYAFSREGEALENTTTPAGRDRWAADTQTRCDAVARDDPALLRRTSETPRRWARVLDDPTDQDQ